MRVGRRQASYKGSPDSDAVRAFLCLIFGSRNTPQDLSPSSLPCYVPLAPVSCFDASARDIKRLRLMVSVRKGRLSIFFSYEFSAD